MLPSFSDTAILDAHTLAGELSHEADTLEWSRKPEMGELEKVAETATAAG